MLRHGSARRRRRLGIGSAWLILLGVLVAAGPLPAQAWGRDGHRAVAELAEVRLRPEAARAIATLLSGEPEPTLPGIANWADERRDVDPSGPRHYVNLPRGDCRYVARRDCAGGRCVVAAIEAARARLADRRAPPASRRIALKQLVHFVADLHQPLHAGHADDRGGNLVQVRWRGEGRNLHWVWDTGLLAAIAPTPGQHRARLLARAEGLIVKPVAPERWAESSCRIVARPGFQPAHALVDEAAYLARWRDTVDAQLTHAGLRLAALLNASL